MNVYVTIHENKQVDNFSRVQIYKLYFNNNIIERYIYNPIEREMEINLLTPYYQVVDAEILN